MCVCALAWVHAYACVHICVFAVRTCRRRTRCLTLASAVSASHSAFLGRVCAEVKPRGLENEKAYQQVSSWRGKKKFQGPFLPTKGEPRNGLPKLLCSGALGLLTRTLAFWDVALQVPIRVSISLTDRTSFREGSWTLAGQLSLGFWQGSGHSPLQRGTLACRILPVEGTWKMMCARRPSPELGHQTSHDRCLAGIRRKGESLSLKKTTWGHRGIWMNRSFLVSFLFCSYLPRIVHSSANQAQKYSGLNISLGLYFLRKAPVSCKT